MPKLDEIIDAQYYCNNEDCPAREVNVWLKFYGPITLKLFEKKKLQCPICSQKLKTHYEKKWK